MTKKLSNPITIISGLGIIALLNALNLIVPFCVLGIALAGIWAIFSRAE